MSDVTNMRDAKPGDATWVYPLPTEWHGEYAWTTDTTAEFDEIDEPVTIVRQRWLLERTETVVFHPRTELCPECHGDGETTTHGILGVDLIRCPVCEGDGRHPLAGTMEVLS